MPPKEDKNLPDVSIVMIDSIQKLQKLKSHVSEIHKEYAKS